MQREYITSTIDEFSNEIEFCFDVSSCPESFYWQQIVTNIERFSTMHSTLLLFDQFAQSQGDYSRGYIVSVVDKHFLLAEYADDAISLRKPNAQPSTACIKEFAQDYSETERVWPWHVRLTGSNLNGLYKYACQQIKTSPQSRVQESFASFNCLPVFESIDIESNISNVSHLNALAIDFVIGRAQYNLRYGYDESNAVQLLSSHASQMRKFCEGASDKCVLLQYWDDTIIYMEIKNNNNGTASISICESSRAAQGDIELVDAVSAISKDCTLKRKYDKVTIRTSSLSKLKDYILSCEAMLVPNRSIR